MADNRLIRVELGLSDEGRKTYGDYLEEISREELFDGLLGYGLFGDKLPPILSSVSFANYWKSEKGHSWPKKERDFITYKHIRNTGGMRIMGIPHPIAYGLLCEELAEDWERIRGQLISNSDGQLRKVSRVHIRKQANSKKLFKMNYGGWFTDGDPVPRMELDSQYEVVSDITQCFPSIYSHAISWALVGRDVAKKKRQKNHWFNKIDIALRNCTNGETHGILVGPHASNLLSEVILTRIDKVLCDKGYKFIRHIDDYRCFVNTHREAEEFIRNLDLELHQYGLIRNQTKTKIMPSPLPSEDEWPRGLKSFPLPSEEVLSRGQVRAFLDYAIDLANQNNGNAAVLNYALKMLSKRMLTKPAQELYVIRSLQFVRLFPNLAPVLDESVMTRYVIPKDSLADLCEGLLTYAKQNNSWYSAYYAFYYALKSDFSLKGINVADALESGDCILKVLELAYAKKHNNREALKKLKADAKRLQGDEHDAERNWLFVYEALNGDLEGDLKSVKRAGISFLSLPK